MAQSEFLIVMCSPRSAKSQWVNREVAWFKTHRDARKILTLIVDGEPGASAMPGREAEECFPKTLLYRVDENLEATDQIEDAPLAADARDTGDGRRGAKLKIAAAMLGVGLDTLAKRDDRRRAQRRRIVMAGMAASMAILAGISVYAELQRRTVVIARNDAVAAKKDAEFQRDEAQSLFEFMLTDLRQRLDAVGRLDILETVAERLNESYAKQDLEKLDADALGRRARVQLLLGEVDNTRGNLDAALAQYKEAAATTEELLKRNPGKAQQIFDHAQSVFWVGYIAWQRGDANEAKTYFTQYKDYADQLVAIDPENEDWQMEVKYALNNLGTLAMDEGDAAEAEGYFRKSLDLVMRLSEKDPNDVDRILSAGQAYAWLADALYRQLEFSDAIAARSTEIHLYTRSLERNPHNTSIIMQSIIARYSFAQLSLIVNNLDDALSAARTATQLADELTVADAENAELADRSSFAYSVLGAAYLYGRQFAEAKAALTKAITIADALVEKDTSVLEWRGVTLAEANLVLGAVEFATSNPERGREHYSATVDALRPLISRPNVDPIIVQRYCSALAGNSRQKNSVESNWDEIITLLAPTAAKQGPEALALLAEAHERVGKHRVASAIVERLYAAGYRHPNFLALLEEFPALKAAVVADGAAE